MWIGQLLESLPRTRIYVYQIWAPYCFTCCKIWFGLAADHENHLYDWSRLINRMRFFWWSRWFDRWVERLISIVSLNGIFQWCQWRRNPSSGLFWKKKEFHLTMHWRRNFQLLSLIWMIDSQDYRKPINPQWTERRFRSELNRWFRIRLRPKALRHFPRPPFVSVD